MPATSSSTQKADTVQHPVTTSARVAALKAVMEGLDEEEKNQILEEWMHEGFA